MVRRAAVSRPQWSREPAGSLGGRAGLFAVHDRGRDRRAAGRRRSGRRARRTRRGREYLRETADAWNASIERWLYVDGHRTGAAACGVDGYYVRVAEPDRADAASPCQRVRADQEPAAGSESRAPAESDGQPGRARVRALRAARGRRSAHREHGEGHRRARSKSTRRAVRRGIATRATATASTPTAGRSTEPASAARGRC